MTTRRRTRYNGVENPIRPVLLNDRRGFALVLAAAAIPVILMVAVIIIDLGMAQVMRAQLQTALDAAALAGVGTPGVFEVRNETEYRANIVTENFEPYEKLPPKEQILSKTPVYRTKTRTVCEDVQDPTTGEVRRECHQEEYEVLDHWRVRYVAGYEPVTVPVLQFSIGPAQQEANRTIDANAEAWEEGGFRGLFRNLQIEEAQIMCENVRTGEVTVAPAGECPSGSQSDEYRIRYRIIRGSVEYKTLLAGTIFGLLKDGQPDPWITIRLGDQEAALELKRQ